MLKDDSLDIESRLPPDPNTHADFGFPRVLVQRAPLDAASVDQLDALAFDLADAAFESVPNNLLQCIPAAANDECAIDYITGLLRRTFRRPATAQEIEDYVNLAVATGNDVGNATQGLAFATAAALQSPEFIYLPEYGEGAGERALTAHEFAARLSFFLWESPPDASLAAKADSGEILQSEVLQSEMDRLLADPRAGKTLQAFFATWLGYDDIETISRNTATFPKFSVALARSMRTEIEHLVDATLGGAEFKSLFLSRTASIDPLLANLYGLADEAPVEQIERWQAEEAGAGCNTDGIPTGFHNICSGNNPLSHAFTTTESTGSLHRLTLRAYGTRADAELPIARVTVNGTFIGDLGIDAAADAPAEYAITLMLDSGPQNVEVRLHNDLFIDRERNRDIIVDWIQLDEVNVLNGQQRDEVTLPPVRAGFMTRGAMLAKFAKPIDTSPTARGLFVRNRLLCENVPPPPPEADTQLPPRDETVRTNRERVAAHLEQGNSCFACHRMMDPLGLPLENFDGIGEYRTHEQGVELDVTGDIDGAQFDGAIEFSQLLVTDPRLYNCAVEQLAKAALGKEEGLTPAGAIRTIGAEFAADQSFKALLKRLILSDAFRKVTDAE